MDKTVNALLKGYLAKADEKLRSASSLLKQGYYTSHAKPFVLSLSKHEMPIHPSTGSG